MNQKVRELIFNQFLYDTLLKFEEEWRASPTDVPVPEFFISGPVTVRPYEPTQYWSAFISDFVDSVLDTKPEVPDGGK